MGNLSNFHLRDISIALAGDNFYYLTGTSTAVWPGSDGYGVIRMWRSAAATGPYTGGGHVVYNITTDCHLCNSSAPHACTDGAGGWGRVWAPEFHYLPSKAADVPGSGGYFLTHNFQCGGGNTGVLQSTSGLPYGPYANLLWGAGGGDVSLFQDPADGAVYTVTSGGGGITAHKLSPIMSYIVESLTLNAGCEGDCSQTGISFEGPFIYFDSGTYFLSASAFGNASRHGGPNSPYSSWNATNCSNCFYSTYAGRADAFAGPYLDVAGGAGGWLSVDNGGHNVLFQTPAGELYSTIWYGDRSSQALPDRGDLVDVPSIIGMQTVNGRLIQATPSAAAHNF